MQVPTAGVEPDTAFVADEFMCMAFDDQRCKSFAVPDSL